MPKSNDKMGELLNAAQKLNDGTTLWDETAFNKVIETAEKSNKDSITLLTGQKVQGSAINFSSTTSDNTGKFVKTLGNWKIVSFRFDPCAPQDLPLLPDPANQDEKLLDPKCRTQVRLIAQPIARDEDAGRPLAQDVTAHLVFGYDTTEAKAIARKLLAIKTDATTGKALGVHPAMTKPGGEVVARQMRLFLLDTLSAKNLQLISFMGLQAPGEPWAFFGGQVIHDNATGKVTDFKVFPQAFGKTIVGTQVLSFIDGGQNAIKPNFGSTRPNSSPVFKIDNSPFLTLADKIGSQTVADTFAEIENPEHSALLLSDQGNVKHRDCLSCHTTTQQLFATSVDKDFNFDKKMLANFINSPKRFSVASNKRFEGITGYANSKVMQIGSWDIRNFGNGTSDTASISMRTLNEAIIVTATTNELLGLENPAKGLKCKELEVWTCLLDRENKGDCMKTFCSQPQVASVELGGEEVEKEKALKLAVPSVPGGICITADNAESFDAQGIASSAIPKGTTLSAQGLVATEGVNKDRMAVRLPAQPNAKTADNLRFIDPKHCQVTR